jgi:hypothetical protein
MFSSLWKAATDQFPLLARAFGTCREFWAALRPVDGSHLKGLNSFSHLTTVPRRSATHASRRLSRNKARHGMNESGLPFFLPSRPGTLHPAAISTHPLPGVVAESAIASLRPPAGGSPHLGDDRTI